MDQNIKNVEIRLDNIEVLTSGATAEFVNGILDFLLYQRRQIPFVYKTYKYYVDKWSDADKSGESEAQESFAHYQRNQQRSKAKATKKSISDMREIIRQAFGSSKVKSLRFLFGNNTFMPSEAYTLHIPHDSISRDHYCDHHALPEGRINQALLRLLTCEELYTLFSTELNTTNVFLEIELLTDIVPCDFGNLIPKHVSSKLPRSCKNIHLHLLHCSENTQNELRCCKEMDIYQDLGLLNLDKSGADVSKTNEEQDLLKAASETSGWWQAEVIVRGFRAPGNQKSGDLWTS
ncbi:uncharacterized protein LOC6555206 [Drosophila erecta]|uniref:GG11237 n=1 Tax=Drosophila erecta TaxID=7220 RepID=B3P8C0_DROER|nr:uncharacterized protein LOC6555206 [Drosophila erecta]EDV53944.1 uncharacterized protein Dere_GG11237 [Drosophila erecta]